MYDSLIEYLRDPDAPDRPKMPPGGTCGPKDDAHMTFLAGSIRRAKNRAEQIDKLARYAGLLQSVAPGDPVIDRVMKWHEELIGA